MRHLHYLRILILLSVGMGVARGGLAAQEEAADSTRLFKAAISETGYDISLEELARHGNRSLVKVEIRSAPSVGGSMWIGCQVAELTNLRGFRYSVVLDRNVADNIMEIGFLNSSNVDLKKEFGKGSFEYGEGEIADAVELFATICGPPSQTSPASTSVAGTYSVTFTAASSCSQLPVDRRSRTYTATISQTGSKLDVVLSGAKFWEHSALGRLNRFSGALFGDAVVFWIVNSGWGFVEQITSATYFEIIGVAQGTIRDSTISGAVEGGLAVGQDLRDDARHVGCNATDHAFTLTRR